MAGAGNIYRHDYEDVAARHVWDTLQIDLPPLLAVITQELATLDPPPAGLLSRRTAQRGCRGGGTC